MILSSPSCRSPRATSARRGEHDAVDHQHAGVLRERPVSFETCDLLSPDSPIACTRSSSRRVDTPPIQASWITAINTFFELLRAVAALRQATDTATRRRAAEVDALPQFGMHNCKMPRRRCRGCGLGNRCARSCARRCARNGRPRSRSTLVSISNCRIPRPRLPEKVNECVALTPLAMVSKTFVRFYGVEQCEFWSPEVPALLAHISPYF